VKVPTFAQAGQPVTFEDAAVELARRLAQLEDVDLVLALERRLRPEEADELAGRPRGWAYREIRAGRLPYEKDPGGERASRGRVGAVRIPLKVLLTALEARLVKASAPAPRTYRRRSGALAKLRASHATAAAQELAS